MIQSIALCGAISLNFIYKTSKYFYCYPLDTFTTYNKNMVERTAERRLQNDKNLKDFHRQQQHYPRNEITKRGFPFGIHIKQKGSSLKMWKIISTKLWDQKSCITSKLSIKISPKLFQETHLPRSLKADCSTILECETKRNVHKTLRWGQ